MLGEIYEYRPSLTEVAVAAGIFAIGFLVFTLMLKAAVPMMLGDFTINKRPLPDSPFTGREGQPMEETP